MQLCALVHWESRDLAILPSSNPFSHSNIHGLLSGPDSHFCNGSCGLKLDSTLLCSRKIACSSRITSVKTRKYSGRCREICDALTTPKLETTTATPMQANVTSSPSHWPAPAARTEAGRGEDLELRYFCCPFTRPRGPGFPVRFAVGVKGIQAF
jgi:hypothetical protein